MEKSRKEGKKNQIILRLQFKLNIYITNNFTVEFASNLKTIEEGRYFVNNIKVTGE